jgi:hypothetical protein
MKPTALTVKSADNTSAYHDEPYTQLEKEEKKVFSNQLYPLSTKTGTVYQCRTVSSPLSKVLHRRKKHDSNQRDA